MPKRGKPSEQPLPNHEAATQLPGLQVQTTQKLQHQNKTQ